jgi:hypothetical protein
MNGHLIEYFSFENPSFCAVFHSESAFFRSPSRVTFTKTFFLSDGYLAFNIDGFQLYWYAGAQTNDVLKVTMQSQLMGRCYSFSTTRLLSDTFY